MGRTACAALVLVVGVLSLSEHLVGWNVRIDQLLFREQPGPPGSLSPGRPGPPASLCFVLSGCALLLLHARTGNRHFLLQALAIAIGVMALFGLIGYAYGAEALYGIAQYTAIRLPHGVGRAVFGRRHSLCSSRGGPCIAGIR